MVHIFMFCHFADTNHQHDPDDDSALGPSISTDTKSTIFSEVSFYLPHDVVRMIAMDY